MVGIHCIHPISLRVSPVDWFRQLFKLLMEVILVLVITLVKLVVSLQGVHLSTIIVTVVTLDWLNLLVLVQFKERVIIVDLFFIVPVSVLVVG